MKGTGTLLLTLILSGFSALRCGATIYPSNGTAASVQSILNNQAQNGDTITLPAGIFAWTTGVVISKAITLQGAGVGNTVIRDNVQGNRIIFWTLPNVAGNSRLTGIEFQDGGGTHSAAPTGAFHVDGTNSSGATFRWDHCYWNNVNGSAVFDTVIGVIDHNTFYVARGSIPLYFYATRWNGRSFGDGSWAAPTNYGSSQFTFVEDCTFTFNVGGLRTMTDAYAGARFVIRHNTIHDGVINNHGTESTGRIRGGRAMEVYNNTYTGTNLNRFVGGSRSGGVLFHDNIVSGYWGINATFTLINVRNYMSFAPWGGADGTNAWDVNEPNAFFTGTAASNSSNLNVAVSGANWASNQWVGYVLRRTSNVCNSGSLNYGEIQSNTSNTITYTGNGGYPNPPDMSICAGDTFEIRKVDHALDQCGRAGGSLITGDPPVRPAGWNDQVTEPCYAWNNGQVHFEGGPGVRANVHYFNNTRMPGYTPYVYPHPLTTSLNPATLGNISTRSFVQTGDNVMVGGFIIQGTEPKRVIIRAIGPELTQHGVPNALVDPTLELHDGTGALIASNYNWQTTQLGGIITANQVSAIRNSGYAPSQASESAIIATLPPGNYTAIVSGVNNTTGVALVDVYDLQ